MSAQVCGLVSPAFCRGECNGTACVCPPGFQSERSQFALDNCAEPVVLLPVASAALVLFACFVHVLTALKRPLNGRRFLALQLQALNACSGAVGVIVLAQDACGLAYWLANGAIIVLLFNVTKHVFFFEIKSLLLSINLHLPDARVMRAMNAFLVLAVAPWVVFGTAAGAVRDFGGGADAYNALAYTTFCAGTLCVLVVIPGAIVLHARLLAYYRKLQVSDKYAAEPEARALIDRAIALSVAHLRTSVASCVGGAVYNWGIASAIVFGRVPYLASLMFVLSHGTVAAVTYFCVRYAFAASSAEAAAAQPDDDQVADETRRLLGLGRREAAALLATRALEVRESDCLVGASAWGRAAALLWLRFVVAVEQRPRARALVWALNAPIVVALWLVLVGALPREAAWAFAAFAVLAVYVYATSLSRRVLYLLLFTPEFFSTNVLAAGFLAAFLDMVAYDARACIGACLFCFIVLASAGDAAVGSARFAREVMTVSTFCLCTSVWVILQFALVDAYSVTVVTSPVVQGAATFSSAQFARDSMLAICIFLANDAVANLRRRDRFSTVSAPVKFKIVAMNDVDDVAVTSVTSAGSSHHQAAAAAAAAELAVSTVAAPVSQLGVESGVLVDQDEHRAVDRIAIKRSSALVNVVFGARAARAYFAAVTPLVNHALVTVSILGLLPIVAAMVALPSTPLVALAAAAPIACQLVIALSLSVDVVRLLVRRVQWQVMMLALGALWAMASSVMAWDARVLVSTAFALVLAVGSLLDAQTVHVAFRIDDGALQSAKPLHDAVRLAALVTVFSSLAALPLALTWGVIIPYRDTVVSLRRDLPDDATGDAIYQISIMQWSGDVGLSLCVVMTAQIITALTRKRRGFLASVTRPLRPVYVGDLMGPQQ